MPPFLVLCGAYAIWEGKRPKVRKEQSDTILLQFEERMH